MFRHFDGIAAVIIVVFAIINAVIGEQIYALLWTILAIAWINFMYVGHISRDIKALRRKMDWEHPE